MKVEELPEWAGVLGRCSRDRSKALEVGSWRRTSLNRSLVAKIVIRTPFSSLVSLRTDRTAGDRDRARVEGRSLGRCKLGRFAKSLWGERCGRRMQRQKR